MSLGFNDRHSLIGKVEEYNRRIQLQAFHINGNFTEDDIEYEGALRFFLAHAENNFTKAVKLSSSTTWKDLKSTLYEKFNLTEGIKDGQLVPILYASTDSGESSVRDEDRPLVMALEKSANIEFVLKVYTKDKSPTESPPAINQSQNFFTAMKKKLKKNPSKQSITSTSPQPTPQLIKSGTISREPIRPMVSVHSRQASDASSVGSKKKSGLGSRQSSKDSQTNLFANSLAFNAKSMDNLAKGSSKMRSKSGNNAMSNMLAIDDNNEFITIHGERSELGMDEIAIPIDPNMTVRDIIIDVLEECGISVANVDDYIIRDVIGREMENIWLTDYSRDMNDSEKPLLLISMMKPSEGLSRRFEIAYSHRDDDNHSHGNSSSFNVSFVPKDLKRETSTSLSSISNVTDYNTQTLKFPTDMPYFLTVQSFDPHHDSVIHLIQWDTNVIGSSEDDDKCNIRLFASDIQPQHCRVTKTQREESDETSNVNMAPFPGALVQINDEPIAHQTPLRSGDVVTLGQHYIFIFKDPLSKRALATSSSTLARHTSSETVQPVQYEQPRGTWQEVMNRVMRLHFALDRADELIEKIMAIMDPCSGGYILTPAYLIALALDNSKHLMRGDQLASFINKIAVQLQSAVWESTQALQEDGRDCDSTNPLVCFNILSSNLKVVLFWMANCIELRSHFVELYHDLLIATGQTDAASTENVVNEVIMVLSDAITYTFQQAVYHLTKVLYPTLDLILLDNPFTKAPEDVVSMQDAMQALTEINSLCSSMTLNSDIKTQLFSYLYFFIRTSLCNKIFEDDSATLYYNWEEGVKIRKNIELVENWAAENDMEDANKYLDKIIAVADFLATSKQFLLQASWSQLRDLYPLLSPTQLRHLLDNYSLGNKPVPAMWKCRDEDVLLVMEKGVMESFEDHPPLVMPKESHINITVKVEDPFFQNKLEHLNSIFNAQTSEDETDSGFDVSHSRSPTEIEDPSEKFSSHSKIEPRTSTSSSSSKQYTPIFKKKKDMVKQASLTKNGHPSSSDESDINDGLAKLTAGHESCS